MSRQIENYVKSAGAGADSWRRTGALTFDGNRKVQKKPTLNRIKEHLEMVYNRRLGTVQLLNFVWLETSDGSHP